MILRLLAKVFFSSGLMLIIVLCGIEIWRIWFKQRLVVDPFRYERDGELVPEAGQNFANQLSQDFNQIKNIYDSGSDNPKISNNQRESVQTNQIGVGQSLPSTNQTGVGQHLDTKLKLSDIGDLQPYGIPVSKIIQNLLLWIEQRNELRVSVSERNNHFDVYAELYNPPLIATGNSQRWYIYQEAKDEVSFALSCYLFRQLVTQNQESSPYSKINDEQFCVFTRALQHYQLYLEKLRKLTNNEGANQALEKASQFIDLLLKQETKFPFAYKLAGYISYEQGQVKEAKDYFDLYLKLLESEGQSDQEVETLLANLTVPPEASYFRQQIRPIHPGISVSPDNVKTVGTICCIVQDKKGLKYVLSDENVFFGKEGTSIIQPGGLDGGQSSDKIATLTKTLTINFDQPNRAAGAIAKLEQRIKFSSVIPGVGQIEGIAREVKVGQSVKAIGRTSGIVEGTVMATEVETRIFKDQKAVQFQGLIRTTSISKGGDSGAPVLIDKGNGKYQLVGIIYAGSPTQTLIIPIQNILDELEVTLYTDSVDSPDEQ